jgi:hypothetical protein
MRCSCLPIYTPGPGPQQKVCPPECLQAASVIIPTEQGLGCNDDVSFDLTELTDPGNCSNTSFSIFDVSSQELTVSLVGTTLTITNDSDDGDIVGEYITVEYIMNCEDDIRSVVGFIQVYITDVCV